MQILSTALHVTLDSYLSDALQEGSADAVACLPAPQARASWIFSSFFPLILLIGGFHCCLLL
jgi:hypothetical protein